MPPGFWETGLGSAMSGSNHHSDIDGHHIIAAIQENKQIVDALSQMVIRLHEETAGWQAGHGSTLKMLNANVQAIANHLFGQGSQVVTRHKLPRLSPSASLDDALENMQTGDVPGGESPGNPTSKQQMRKTMPSAFPHAREPRESISVPSVPLGGSARDSFSTSSGAAHGKPQMPDGCHSQESVLSQHSHASSIDQEASMNHMVQDSCQSDRLPGAAADPRGSMDSTSTWESLASASACGNWSSQPTRQSARMSLASTLADVPENKPRLSQLRSESQCQDNRLSRSSHASLTQIAEHAREMKARRQSHNSEEIQQRWRSPGASRHSAHSTASHSLDWHSMGTLGDHFELDVGWKMVLPKSKTGRLTSIGGFLGVGHMRSSCESEHNPVDSEAGGPCIDKWMMPPSAQKRVAWDSLTGVILLCEAMITPFSLCFSPDESAMGTLLRVITTLFWFMDMIMCFATGYNKNGHIVMSFRAIAKRYLRTWLSLDLFLLALDISMLTATAGNPVASQDGATSGLKVLRLARAVRLLRLFKLRRMVQDLAHFINSETMFALFTIFSRLCVIFIVTHTNACGWYLCATYAEESSGNSWVKFHSFENEDVFSKYLVSLHWALTQVHGTMEVAPQNDAERVYAVTALFGSLFVFTVLIGNFANLMSNLWAADSYKQRQLWLLRRYLKQLQVGHWVSEKVDTYLQHVLTKRMEQVNCGSIEVLGFLSSRLATELKAASYARHCETHALFAFCCNEQTDAVACFADALTTKWYFDGDLAFTIGDEEFSMCYFIDGDARYHHASEWPDVGIATSRSFHGSDVAYPEEGQSLQPQEWVAEPLLWLQSWIALGDLAVADASQVAEIHPKTFKLACRTNKLMFLRMKSYAEAFVNALNALRPDQLSDLMFEVINPDSTLVAAGLL